MDNQQICLYTNALLGDGHLIQQKHSTRLTFTSTNRSLIEFKASLLGTSHIKTHEQKAHAFGTKPLYTIAKTVEKREISRGTCISTLTLEDFYLWYLDDGTMHKHKYWASLGSHCLSRSQNMELQWHLWHSLGIESQLAFDRRKNRVEVLWYLTFRRCQMISLSGEIKAFAESSGIKGLEHKYCAV